MLRKFSVWRRQSQVVRTVGDEFVTEGCVNFAVFQQENARHALDVASWKAYKVSPDKRTEHAPDTFAIQILAKLGAHQAKLLIQTPLGIAEPWNICQPVRRKEPLGFFFRAQMNESERDAFCFDCFAFFRKLGDRLATESSTEMTKEHEQQAAASTKRCERLAILRGVGAKERRVDLVRSEHARNGHFKVEGALKTSLAAKQPSEP
jgi:hypothetical protein